MRCQILLPVVLFVLSMVNPFHTCAQLRSVMVNACGTEGENEYVVLKNTGSPFKFQTDQIRLWYGTSLPANTPVCDSFCTTPNSGYIQALNSGLDSSCNFRFKALQAGDTIRSGMYILIVHPTPSDTPDLNSWCGVPSDSVAVLFACGNKWRSGGNFANSPSTWRYLRLKFGTDTSDYRYRNGWTAARDGNFVSFDSSGMSPSYGYYPSCDANSADALPVELIEFSAFREHGAVRLNWKTASESDNLGFIVDRSLDGGQWQRCAFIAGAVHSWSVQSYSFTDKNAIPVGCYYRLRDVDGTGDTSEIGLVHVAPESLNRLDIHPNPFHTELFICGTDASGFAERYEEGGQLFIQDMRGTMHRATPVRSNGCSKWEIPDLHAGLYVVTYVHRNRITHWLAQKHPN